MYCSHKLIGLISSACKVYEIMRNPFWDFKGNSGFFSHTWKIQLGFSMNMIQLVNPPVASVTCIPFHLHFPGPWYKILWPRSRWSNRSSVIYPSRRFQSSFCHLLLRVLLSSIYYIHIYIPYCRVSVLSDLSHGALSLLFKSAMTFPSPVFPSAFYKSTCSKFSVHSMWMHSYLMIVLSQVMNIQLSSNGRLCIWLSPCSCPCIELAFLFHIFSCVAGINTVPYASFIITFTRFDVSVTYVWTCVVVILVLGMYCNLRFHTSVLSGASELLKMFANAMFDCIRFLSMFVQFHKLDLNYIDFEVILFSFCIRQDCKHGWIRWKTIMITLGIWILMAPFQTWATSFGQLNNTIIIATIQPIHSICWLGPNLGWVDF